MFFLYNIVDFFRNIYSTIFRPNNETDIKLFLKILTNNWNSINPNNPLYYDILNLYIKYSKEYGFGNDIPQRNINEYRVILDNLNLDKNKNENDIDINEHMKYYITGWYIHSTILGRKKDTNICV
jgi:hypothetical protein